MINHIMMVIGRMIIHMVMDYQKIKVQFTMDNSTVVKNMVQEQRNIVTETRMKVNFMMDYLMGMGFIFGNQMVIYLKGHLNKEYVMEKVNT